MTGVQTCALPIYLAISDITGLQGELDTLGGVWNRSAPNVSFDNGTDRKSVV